MDLVGKTLGQFQIIEELGKGGMATVYKAYQPNLQRHVAIKVLSPKLTDDIDLVKRFLREARSAAALHHPNVIVIHDVGSEGDIHYISTEYVEGMTLAALLEQAGALPQKRVLRIVRQIADALDYAHSRGMIHRDIKPSNIMVDPARNDHVTLMDFGLVQITGGSRLTRTGFIMGTPDYMSPEQAQGDAIDHRTDIYSLGVTVYHMLTGEVPFEKPTPHAVLIAHIMEEPPFLTLREGIAPEIDAVVRRSMAKNPNDRHEWSGDMVNDLEVAMSSPVSSMAGAVSQPGAVADASARVPPASGQTPPAGGIPESQVPLAYGQMPPGTATPELQTPAAYRQTPPGGVTPYPQTPPAYGQMPPATANPGPQTPAAYGQTPPGGVTPYPQVPPSAVVAPAPRGKWIWPTVALGALVLLAIVVVAGLLVVAPLLRQSRISSGTPTLTGTATPVLNLAMLTPTPTVTSSPTPTMPPTATPVATATVSPTPTVPSTATPLPTPTVILSPTLTLTVPPTSTPAATPVRTTATPTPNPGIGVTPVSDQDGMVMAYVPAGTFLMGSTDADQNAEGDEKPQHSVYLDAFYISQYPVTNEQFSRFVAATGYRTDAAKAGSGWIWTEGAWKLVAGAEWRHPGGTGSSIMDKMDHPVVQVTWNDANAYCLWAGKRLPTEAEWEKAARGTDGQSYPWGNSAPDGQKLNFCDANCEIDWRDASVDDGYMNTSPVGHYEAGKSPYGVYDMAGNVWEWVADWYQDDSYRQAPERNPKGPDSGDKRVTRGGSWYNLPWLGRAAFRTGLAPDVRDYSIGFRCVLPVTQ